MKDGVPGWRGAKAAAGSIAQVIGAFEVHGTALVADKLSAFVELERQVLTVTFYLGSTHASSRC